MSLFIDTLAGGDEVYEYGHCYGEHFPSGIETGCGMEYAYYLSDSRLESWHESVGLVTVTENVTPEFIAELDRLHNVCHIV